MGRQRRTQKPEPMTIEEIPLSQPSRDTPRDKNAPKTLFELIEEKTPGLSAAADAADAKNTPLINTTTETIFYTVPLLILLFWFDVLVHLQYRQELKPEWTSIAWRTLRAAPAVFVIHYLVHPRKELLSVRATLWVVSVAAGCYVVRAVNMFGYYFVMKKMPPLATLWIWSVVEMGLVESVLSCVAVTGYFWMGGYKLG